MPRVACVLFILREYMALRHARGVMCCHGRSDVLSLGGKEVSTLILRRYLVLRRRDNMQQAGDVTNTL